MPRIRFFDVSVERAQTALSVRKVFLRTLHYKHRYYHTDKRNGERNKGEPPFGYKHHNKATDKLRRRADYRRQAVRKPLLQSRNVVGDTA